jgi:hypothetical protein
MHKATVLSHNDLARLAKIRDSLDAFATKLGLAPRAKAAPVVRRRRRIAKLAEATDPAAPAA